MLTTWPIKNTSDDSIQSELLQVIADRMLPRKASRRTHTLLDRTVPKYFTSMHTSFSVNMCTDLKISDVAMLHGDTGLFYVRNGE